MRFHRTKTCISVFFKPPQKSVYVHRSVRCIWIIDIISRKHPRHFPSSALLFVSEFRMIKTTVFYMYMNNILLQNFICIRKTFISRLIIVGRIKICFKIFRIHMLYNRFHPFGTLSNIMSLIFQSQIDFPMLRFPDRPPIILFQFRKRNFRTHCDMITIMIYNFCSQLISYLNSSF